MALIARSSVVVTVLLDLSVPVQPPVKIGERKERIGRVSMAE
jgi:hypothetical protein